MEMLSSTVDSGIFYANVLRKTINEFCVALEPWQIMAYTFAVTSLAMYIQYFWESSNKPVKTRIANAVFYWSRKIPWVRNKIEAEIAKAKVDIERSIHKNDKTGEFYRYLPEGGLAPEDILAETDDYMGMGEYDILGGNLSGCCYSGNNPELNTLLTKVFGKTAWTNPLHADVFPSTRKMEAEVVRMVCNMFHGDQSTCGTVTSGGTESLLLCCLAYRNRAYEMGNMDPEIVLPITAHAAFDKAAELFGMRLKHVPLDPETLEVDMNKMRRAISSKTCMLVGSAPNYPHGVVDNIAEISQLGMKKGIPVHVDACLGGFLVPFMEQAGFRLKPFDFRLPGVTSISCDTHKYGFATKGSSVIMYRNEEYLHFQYFAQPNWPGGIYASPTLAGSRCGANIACCWATMLYYGRLGYVAATEKIIGTAREIQQGIEDIEGLDVMGEPEVSVVAFTSKKYNIYNLADRMNKKHWNLNTLQFPAGIHIAVTIHHTAPAVKEKFLRDLREISLELLNKPPGLEMDGKAAIYGTTQAIPDRSIVKELAFAFLDCCYETHNDKTRTGAKLSLTHTFGTNPMALHRKITHVPKEEKIEEENVE